MTFVKQPNILFFFISCVITIFLFSSCKKEDELKNEYGVPSGINLNVPCPGNGTWYTTDMNSSIAKFQSAAPVLYANQFDAKVVIKDWLVEIYPVEYVYTGLCIEVLYQLACDYRPQYTGESIKGYIDPNAIGNDNEGDPIYKGVLTNGWELRYWDFPAPSYLYLNVKTDLSSDNWWKETLKNY